MFYDKKRSSDHAYHYKCPRCNFYFTEAHALCPLCEKEQLEVPLKKKKIVNNKSF